MVAWVLDYENEIKRYRLPKDLEMELVRVFKAHNQEPTKLRHTTSKVSFKTSYKRFVAVAAALRELHDMNYRLQKLDSLSEKHIRALVEHWEQNGNSVGTMDNKLSSLRTMSAWIGKPDMVKKSSSYATDPATFKRAAIATEDKTWGGHGLDILSVIERVRREDRVVAMQLELSWAFGMRVEEAMCFPPIKALNKAVEKLSINVELGTKGGRARTVDIDDVLQMDVLFRAADLATGDNRSMIPKTHTLDEWKNHYYYVLKKTGIRKNTEAGGLGVTAHGLRHEYLNQLFQRITGKASPIKGGEGYDKGAYALAMQVVVERAGHFDKYKAGAYLSTPMMMRRMKNLLQAAQTEIAPHGKAALDQIEPVAPIYVVIAPGTWLRTRDTCEPVMVVKATSDMVAYRRAGVDGEVQTARLAEVFDVLPCKPDDADAVC